MQFISLIKTFLFGKKIDIAELRKRIQKGDNDISERDLLSYVEDINLRVQEINKQLKSIYKVYGIKFIGFKAFSDAYKVLKQSLGNNEIADNNLIKLEYDSELEQKRHLALIKIAATKEGIPVINKILSDPAQSEIYKNIFGLDNAYKVESDKGLYHKLWFEIHKLAEYIILHKSKVYSQNLDAGK